LLQNTFFQVEVNSMRRLPAQTTITLLIRSQTTVLMISERSFSSLVKGKPMRLKLSAVIALLIALSGYSNIALGAKQTVISDLRELQSKELPTIQYKEHVRMKLVRNTDGAVVGREYIRKDQRYLQIGDTEFVVADVEDTLVSRDGAVILKYGQRGEIHDPSKSDFFWYNAQGQLITSVTDRFAPQTVAMSSAGHVAMCGRESKNNQQLITIFGLNGQEVAPSKPVPQSKACVNLAIDSSGQRVLFLAMDSKKSLNDADILFVAPDGEIKTLAKNIRYPQGLFLSRDEKYVFIAGKNKALLADITVTKVLWTIPRFFRLAGKNPIDVNSTENLVVVNSVVFTKTKPTESVLQINILSLENGQVQFQKQLPNVNVLQNPRIQISSDRQINLSTDEKEFLFELVKK